MAFKLSQPCFCLDRKYHDATNYFSILCHRYYAVTQSAKLGVNQDCNCVGASVVKVACKVGI